jgi:hypothetical protein
LQKVWAVDGEQRLPPLHGVVATMAAATSVFLR